MELTSIFPGSWRVLPCKFLQTLRLIRSHPFASWACKGDDRLDLLVSLCVVVGCRRERRDPDCCGGEPTRLVIGLFCLRNVRTSDVGVVDASCGLVVGVLLLLVALCIAVGRCLVERAPFRASFAIFFPRVLPRLLGLKDSGPSMRRPYCWQLKRSTLLSLLDDCMATFSGDELSRFA